MNLKAYYELDKIFAISGGLFSTIMIAYFINEVTYVFTGFLILLSCIIWLLIRDNVTLDLNLKSWNLTTLLLYSLFFIIFILSIISVYLRSVTYERPLLYYLLISLMVGIIAIEIIYSKKATCYAILFQIIIVGTSLAWSQILIFPSLLGVDPWYHQALTLDIINNNFIPPGYGYSKLPMFHLLVASTSLITDLNYKHSVMLSASLAQILCNCLFIFLLSKFLFKNYVIGLLASLLLIISNYHIFMSYWSIPNSFAAIFIPLILYVSYKVRNEMQFNGTILLLFFMVILILTHSVTAMCMAIMLLISWSVSMFYKSFSHTEKSTMTLNYSLLFITFMFFWWTFASGHIRTLSELIKWGFSRDYFIHTPSEIISEGGMTILERLVNILGPYLFFALALVGLFYMISKNGDYFSFNISFVGGFPLVLGFLSVVSQHSIIESRWLYFAQILLSIPVALAIILISNKIKKPSLKPIFIICITIIVMFLMLIHPTASVDNQIFSPNSSARASLTASELQAIQTVPDFWDGTIKTDNYFAHSQSFIHNTKPFDDELYHENLDYLDNNLILVRDEIICKPFRIYSSITTIDYNLESKLTQMRFLKVYDCGSVFAFLKF